MSATTANPNAAIFDAALRNHEAGRLGEAERLYQQVLRVDPRHADALHLLGVVAHQSGRHDVATGLIEQAIAINGDNHLYHSNLGATQQARGRISDAIASGRRAVALNPNYAAAHYNLARALQAAGHDDEAEAEYRRTLQLAPQHAEAHLNLGNLLSERGELAAAVAEFRESVRSNPQFAYAHYNLGNALYELGQSDEALACFETTVALKPDYAEAHNNLGNIHRGRDQLDEALHWFSTACRLNPQHAVAHNNRASVLQSLGRLPEAIADYQTSRRLAPRDAATHSNLLVAANYAVDLSPQQLYELHRDWARQHAERQRPLAHRCRPDYQRRLRIGYCSPDFRAHPVAHFFLPLLTSHDRDAVEVSCYSNTPRPDRTTEHLRSLADRWRDVRRLSDAELAETVAADEIDILVDLAGHTARNRLLAFAAKPAPVQVSFLGYPNTTGLSSIDYRLTDAITDPPGEPRAHSESLVHLPSSFCCYAPVDFDITPKSLPADRRGAITFGSLHNLAKLNRHVIAAWSAVLRSVPRSRLLIARTTLSASAGERLLAEFAQLGVAGARVELRRLPTTPGGHLQAYHDIDIILDTFPWSGHTTTCEALWMGVPVLTLRGDRHAARMGASLMTHLGLNDWIAASATEYVDMAAPLAADLPRLRELRATLRPRLLSSPICDGPRFAAAVEAAFRAMWQRWCDGRDSSGLDNTKADFS